MKLPYYPLHLIEPFALTNEELMKYGPEVGTVLVFIKNSKNQYQLNFSSQKIFYLDPKLSSSGTLILNNLYP